MTKEFNQAADQLATRLRFEAMTDEELEALLDEDPPTRAVMDRWPDADLEKLAVGEAKATRRFDTEVRVERHEG